MHISAQNSKDMSWKKCRMDYIAMRRRKLFLRFVKDVSTFVGLLDRTGSVVSGSCALNLLQAERNAVIPQDMDVYTTERFQTEVLDHLKNREGYQCAQEVVKKTDYDSSAICKIGNVL